MEDFLSRRAVPSILRLRSFDAHITQRSAKKELPMPDANDEERLSSDGEWVEDGWVVMEDDIHAKWVCTLA